MNITLIAALLTATTTPQTYQITLEAHAIRNECPASVTCFKVQGRQFAVDFGRDPGSEFTAAFDFVCDFDEKCELQQIRIGD